MISSLDAPQGPLETSDGDPDGYIRQARYGSNDYDDFAPSLPEEQAFRHGGEKSSRRRIYEALLRTHQSCRRVANYADCGGTLWLMRDGSEPVLVCGKCHDRLCGACQRERAAAVVEGVLLRCHDARDRLRFATLTIKHSDAPLDFQIKRLTSSFKLLRQHPRVGPMMVGGVWFLEVKLDKSGSRWHPHLHVIVEGEFIAQKELAAAWYATTGDSYMVDIRAVDDISSRARYVSKYATKPLHPGVVRVAAKLDEFVRDIKGKRLYQCFGTWAKAVKRGKSPKRKLTRVAHLSVMHANAVAGCDESRYWLHICHGRWPRLRRIFPLTEPPTPPPPLMVPVCIGAGAE